MPAYMPTISKFKSRIRIVVGLLLAAVVFISAWGIVSERQAIINTAERQTEGYARALAEHSESAFGESDRVLKDVLHSIRREGGLGRLRQEDLFHELRRLVADSPQIGSLFVADRHGNMVVNSIDFPSKKINVADRDYFRYYLNNPKADLSITKPVMSRLVNRWRFNLIRPLNKPGETYSGLVAVAFEVKYFKRFFSAASLGQHGRIALIRTDGFPLVFEPYIENVYESDLRKTKLFREKLPVSPSGTFQVEQDPNALDKSPHIVSYQRLFRFPVVAVVSLNKDDILAPWSRKAIMQSSLTLGLCLMIIVLTRILFRHLDRLLATQNSLHEQQEQVRVKAAQIDAANDAILLLDIEGRLLQANNSFCKLTGYSQEELIGKLLHDIKPAELAARINPNIKHLQQRGKETFESAYLTRNGSVLPVEISAQVIESNGKQLILSIARDISERKRGELRERARLHILEEMATGSSLTELLQHIVSFVEQDCEGALCSVLLVDDSGTRLRHGAAPSLPDYYNQVIDGLRIAEGIGSCGTAAHRRQRVVAEDIEVHPFWKGFKPAREIGLRSCWSEPVISAEGDLLGTFAVYHREPHSPASLEIKLIEAAANLASIAIGRCRSDEQRKHLEAQLHHVQRIEAVGQLAGGIAHDFNNLLTPIFIYADMIQRKLPDGDPLTKKTMGIISAANKARDLTKQLLSFGRKQLLTMKAVDLDEIIATFHDILRRTIRENITIDMQPAPKGVVIWADRGQVEQILLNLAVNAQDAITGNGKIVVETGHVVIDNEYARQHPGMQPGPYALLAFSDSGCGMNDETLSHIFEPFFTTKQIGHGTGLGLATVYGIVKQHEGYIAVNSRIDEGTVFRIYLPLAKGPVEVSEAGAQLETPKATTRGGGTILVVEDNEMVRTMTVELLESSGYRVIVAELPSVAKELAIQHGDVIELLVTDVIMPEMNGQELYETICGTIPGLKVLYMSGYTNELFVHGGALEENINFLQKPFTAERFLERVRQMLE